MATERNVEFKHMLLNACVLLDRPPAINGYSNSDLLLQLRSFYVAKRRKRVRQPFLLCSDIGKNGPRTVLKSPNRTEDYLKNNASR